MLKTRRISITGVDGTGKTTLIREIRAMRKPGVYAFRAPQFHEDPDAPFGFLSQKIDDLSVLADVSRALSLKACALFLSMTLYGDVEAHYLRAFSPSDLLSERQCVADSVTYSKFYKAVLNGPLDESVWRKKISDRLGEEALVHFEEWILVLRSRLPEGSKLNPDDLTMWRLPVFVRSLFDLEPESLVKHLLSLYHCELPHELVLLNLKPDRLMERLSTKQKAGVAEELHEKKHILEALQRALIQSCGFLQKLKPEMKVHLLDTGELSLEESKAEVLRILSI
jgi:hypothetical protein